MEDFLNDPYLDTKRRYNSGNTRWPTDNSQFSNLDDLQFTVAPDSSTQHDTRSNYAMFAENQPQNQNASVAKDPYLETFDFLGSPIQQAVSPNLPPGTNDAWSENLGGESLYTDGFNLNAGMDPLNNLDLLVLPDNSNSNVNGNGHDLGNNGLNMFSSSQYFSPNSRGANFGQLNSIVEDSVSPSYYNKAFSPTQSRHGSISIPPPLNSYLLQHTLLSPQTNALDGSFDTLKLPYSGSYLNSPPTMSLSHSTGMNLTPSYAPSQTYGQLPNTQNYGMGPSSVGATSNTNHRNGMEQPGTPKQLTLEEKAKRRREFHNAVERRRRDLIKEKIKALGFLVPPSLLTPQVCAVQALLKQQDNKEIKELVSSVRIKDAKPNKAFILLTSVDYIRHLHYVLEKQNARRKELEDAIAKLSIGSSPAEVKSEESFHPTVKVESTLLPSEFNPDEFFSADI